MDEFVHVCMCLCLFVVVFVPFLVVQLCYQFGVLLSRSSLGILRVRKVHILTLLQFLNFLAWGVLVLTQSVGVWLQFVLMVWVSHAHLHARWYKDALTDNRFLCCMLAALDVLAMLAVATGRDDGRSCLRQLFCQPCG